MNEVNWVDGPPTEDGIYWWDSGFKHSFFASSAAKRFLIAQVMFGGKDVFVFGDHGSMPLSSVYHPGLSKRARHAVIAPSNEWKSFANAGDITRTWIKSPRGWRGAKDSYTGFALLSRDTHGPRGSILWLNHPQSASECGVCLRTEDGHLYSPVEIPG